MVVDDETDVVLLIKFLLEKDGHEVQTAYNGIEALAKLGVDPASQDGTAPDLILLDVMMPQLDGYSVCARLAEHPALKLVPVLVLTAKGEVRDIFAQTPNVGAIIEKPFDPKKLRELISGMLSPGKDQAHV